jgi:hypothetical protein
MVSKPKSGVKRRRNATQKRALKSAVLSLFMQQYGRKAQRGVEPNDRGHSRGVESAVKRMKPVELDRLLRDDED